MEAGIPSLVDCPHCGTRYSKEEWVSYNTFGATLWTDGVLFGDGVPPHSSPYGKCTQCGGFFSLEKSKVKAKTTQADLNAAKRVRGLSITDCLTILSNRELLKVTPPQHVEINLRILIWRRCNDAIRYKEQQSDLPDGNVQRDNMEKLVALLSDSEDDEDILTRAELYRHLGKFSQARKTLSKVKSKEFKRTKQRIAWLSLLRNSALAVVWSERMSFRRRLRKMWRRLT